MLRVQSCYIVELHSLACLVPVPGRDDAYIRAMLGCVRALQVEHVARQPQPMEGPPTCGFRSTAQYAELLERTVSIAQQAVVVAEVAGSELLASSVQADSNAFWGPSAGPQGR